MAEMQIKTKPKNKEVMVSELKEGQVFSYFNYGNSATEYFIVIGDDEEDSYITDNLDSKDFKMVLNLSTFSLDSFGNSSKVVPLESELIVFE